MCVFQTNCDGSAVFDRVVIVPYCSLFCFLLDPIANKAAPSKTLKIVLMSERRMSCSESGQSSRFFFNPQAGVHQTSLIQSIQYPPVSIIFAIPTLKSRCQYFLDSQYGKPNVFNGFSSLQLLDSSNELHRQAIDQKSLFFRAWKAHPQSPTVHLLHQVLEFRVVIIAFQHLFQR